MLGDGSHLGHLEDYAVTWVHGDAAVPLATSDPLRKQTLVKTCMTELICLQISFKHQISLKLVQNYSENASAFYAGQSQPCQVSM